MTAETTVIGTSENWEREVLGSPVPVMVDFWAEWCGPCRMVSPIIEGLAKKYKGKIKVVKVNVDENQELAEKFNIMSIPTVMLFDKGRPLGSHIGAAPESVFERFIARNLKL